jgi:hypothetical protein
MRRRDPRTEQRMSEQLSRYEEQCKAALEAINKIPHLQSCLYDLGMLPEQLQRGSKEWDRMMQIAFHFRSLAGDWSRSATRLPAEPTDAMWEAFFNAWIARGRANYDYFKLAYKAMLAAAPAALPAAESFDLGYAAALAMTTPAVAQEPVGGYDVAYIENACHWLEDIAACTALTEGQRHVLPTICEVLRTKYADRPLAAPVVAVPEERRLPPEANELASMMREAERYRLWRDGTVLVRRCGIGWEACHKDSDKLKADSWHAHLTIDTAIDAARAGKVG